MMLSCDEQPYLRLPFPTEGTPNLIRVRSDRHGSQYRRSDFKPILIASYFALWLDIVGGLPTRDEFFCSIYDHVGGRLSLSNGSQPQAVPCRLGSGGGCRRRWSGGA